MIMIMLMIMIMTMITITITDLARELRKLWKVKTRVVPIVTSALGTIPKGSVGHLASIGVNLGVAQIQKTASLGILRRVLDY